jgi:hypothetical protein
VCLRTVKPKIIKKIIKMLRMRGETSNIKKMRLPLKMKRSVRIKSKHKKVVNNKRKTVKKPKKKIRKKRKKS